MRDRERWILGWHITGRQGSWSVLKAQGDRSGSSTIGLVRLSGCKASDLGGVEDVLQRAWGFELREHWK